MSQTEAPTVITRPKSPQVTYQVRLRVDPDHIKQNIWVDTVAKRKIIKAGRRFGKTVSAARIAVEAFLKGRRVLYGVPTSDQLNRFWAEVNWSLEQPIEGGLYKKNETEHFIELPRTNQRIRAKTMWNPATARGDYADDLILDEWQLMDEDVWGYVGAPMLADNNGNAVFMFTVPSLHSREISKAQDPRHAVRMYKDALEEMRLAREEGRPSEWFAMHGVSHDNPNLSKEGLASMVRDMTTAAYKQEILGEDVNEAEGALWTYALLDQTRVRLTQ